jgi:TnpA family transposase
MTAIERTAYPRFKEPLAPRELEDLYTPLPPELAFVDRIAKGSPQRLALAVLLKTFQSLGYFPALAGVPPFIVRHIRSGLPDESGSADLSLSTTTLYRYHQAVRDYLGVTAYSQGGEEVAVRAIREAAQTMNDPADLINAALEELVRQRVELPGFSTLDRLAAGLRLQVNQQWQAAVLARLTRQERALLDHLPLARDQATRTDFTRLKQPAGRASLTELRRTRDRLRWLESLLDTDRLLAGLPPARIRLFAGEARALEAGDIVRYRPARRYVLLVCLLHEAKTQTRDELATMLIKRMRQIHNSGQEELEVIREQQRLIQEQIIELMAAIAEYASGNVQDVQLGQFVRQALAGAGGAEALVRHCRAMLPYHQNNILPLLWKYYRPHRSVLFDGIEALDIRSTTQDSRLVDALAFLKQHRHRHADHLPADIAIDFASQKWQQLTIRRIEGEVWFDRRHLEVCIFSYVAAALQTGDLYVVGAEEYADLRQDLLPWEECAAQVETYCAGLGLPADPASFVNSLKDWLTAVAEEVDRAFPQEGQVYFKAGRPVLRRLPKRQAPAGTRALQEALKDRMPDQSLLDVLAYAERLVNYTRHFGPLSGSDAKLADPLSRYLMTVFAYGCNIGPTQLARHSRQPLSAKDLSRTHLQHITTDRLDAAIRDVIDAYTRFDLPRFWGTGRAAAADGTLIDIYHNNLLSAYHVRYGRYGGVAYHHVSDTYIALFSHFISVGVWEAVYIIDGLIENDSEIQPEMLHADTQGQSLPVFGLAHLLGIQLMPRIRGWKDLILYRPSADTAYRHIDALFTDTIDWTLIETHWQDMMQVVLSIAAGRILPSALLRRLSNYSRHNRLYRAFRELGRVVRTVFLLRFLSDPELRGQITATTNKVENYHEFTGWITFGGDVLPSNDPLEHEKRVKYTDLVANCLILKNVVDMTIQLNRLHAEGYRLSRDHIARLSPYLTEHTRRFGEYVLDLDTIQIEPLTFEITLEDEPTS